MDDKCFEELLLKLVQNDSFEGENTNGFQRLGKSMSLNEINKPDWWSSVQALEEDLTPSGKELMCILRVLVYKCCEFFKRPSINVNLNSCKSQVYLKRKPALEDDSSKKRQKTFTPEQCSNRENLYTETKYCNTFERYDNVHEKLTNNQDYFLTSLGLQTGCVNETNKNITTWKLAKFKVTPSIPFSSNLGQILMKRDNHHFPDNLKRHRIERVERYINQPCRKSFNVKYDVTYPEKKSKELTFHWYKFPSKKTRQQCISKRDNVAIRCKQLSIKLVRENLNVLREKLKVEQKGKLQVLIPRLSIDDGLRSNKQSTN